ncbi:chemotaxis protein CheA [Acetobacterium fimetarium]|uniref:Chemotaxis protein CheA n=1 Tax=Acetobacterium fimetarium TaxID=52691 RepID=A0ABR6WSH3_9FIRM|nr:chemotaxis protein CheA [Acetobacterium fimetarium]MBC3803191.1 chemotaxis protein CheA [Acetobacterium fimetarium]
MGGFSDENVSEIFRFMHTIKGSSAMMLFNSIERVAHTVEDIFYFIREQKPTALDYSAISDLVLECVDFIKLEVEKITDKNEPDGDAEPLIQSLKGLLDGMKTEFSVDEIKEKPKETAPEQYYIPQEKNPAISLNACYHALVFFQDDCMMENIRAYTLVLGLMDMVEEIYFSPADIADNPETAIEIREMGFEIYMKSDAGYEMIKAYFDKSIFAERLSVREVDEGTLKTFQNKLQAASPSVPKIPEIDLSKDPILNEQAKTNGEMEKNTSTNGSNGQTMISVNVDKLDMLMNLVGELVISESMVTQSPDVEKIEAENFHKASLELHKITEELQDMVMTIRMVSLSNTFMKMNRIVRDMCKKLNKEVVLEFAGEHTEVDKNIIEHISDPLMHVIRNAIDHGIENEDERLSKGKDKVGHIFLEAKNMGSDVLIVVKDDGRGLSREKIIEKAKKNGILEKAEEEMTDKEIYKLILLPGFSTNDSITEYSGRGVGMDVVVKNLESIGGIAVVDSEPDRGTTITMKIPLTLAIVEGMNISVGQSRYTIPITTISESFRPQESDCFRDPDENEMVMIRGKCYPVLRLHEHYKIKNAQTDLTKGILIMVEEDEKQICLFADELLGQQQVVVKSLPHYVTTMKRINGLAGCTLLADGSISLIMDIGGFTGLRIQ